MEGSGSQSVIFLAKDSVKAFPTIPPLDVGLAYIKCNKLLIITQINF